jgi:hypothetical protein
LIPLENFKQVMKGIRALLTPAMHLEQKEEVLHQPLHGIIGMNFNKG